MEINTYILEDFLASSLLKTVALEIKILFAGRNTHIANQHDGSLLNINLEGREFIGYRFLHGYL